MSKFLLRPGYSLTELTRAQERFNLHFPPDLVALLGQGRLPGGYDWNEDEEAIAAALAWPLEGLMFDVEANVLWWPEWGARPGTEAERRAIVGAAVAAAPKLIPLIGHRYLPEEPHAPGNPVFSIYQSDIILYGSDLANFVENEFARPHRYQLGDQARHIRFWSDAVARNCGWAGEGE
ncbi:MAG: hypothetical protein JO276_00555 [Sphingomonadaceae bacterium]|nr:hypothetical protein [Sphingomonadaceae bacterium]